MSGRIFWLGPGVWLWGKSKIFLTPLFPEFLDAQGFVLDEQWVNAPSIAPGEYTFRGLKLILLPMATKVASTEVKVTAP